MKNDRRAVYPAAAYGCYAEEETNVNENKFTPGPWTVEAGVIGYWVNAEDGTPICYISNENQETPASVDANFIAAAPDLFAIAEGMRFWQDHCRCDQMLKFDRPCWFCKSDAAIKKARGQQ